MIEDFPRKKKRKVVFCIPTVTRPYQCCLDSLEASLPLIEQAGWDHYMANSIGCPYISRARETMLRKAQEIMADIIVFIDHDLSWDPPDLLKLIETEGEVIAGTYRFKQEPEEYMGALYTDIHQRPQVRGDGCLLAHCVPAGFLKITRNAVNTFMLNYPELQYVDEGTLTVDLFNHGVHNHVWYGEDYAFSRNWNEKCGKIWIVPDLNINHHLKEIHKDEDGKDFVEEKIFRGNFHQYLLRQPGGSESENPFNPNAEAA